MTDAKPGRCPFCGSEKITCEEYSQGGGPHEGRKVWRCHCARCSSWGPAKTTLAEAIAAFAAPGERIAELEEMLRWALTENEYLTWANPEESSIKCILCDARQLSGNDAPFPHRDTCKYKIAVGLAWGVPLSQQEGRKSDG